MASKRLAVLALVACLVQLLILQAICHGVGGTLMPVGWLRDRAGAGRRVLRRQRQDQRVGPGPEARPDQLVGHVALQREQPDHVGFHGIPRAVQRHRPPFLRVMDGRWLQRDGLHGHGLPGLRRLHAAGQLLPRVDGVTDVRLPRQPDRVHRHHTPGQTPADGHEPVHHRPLCWSHLSRTLLLFFVRFTGALLQVAGNWSLIVDASGENETVGHFPGSLFTDLAGHATVVGWGGNAQSSTGAGPPMGSGQGPDEGDGGAAYVASIAVYDSKGSSAAPAVGNVTSLTDAGDCYSTSDYEVAKDGGGFFYYGGPEGCNH